MNDSGKLLSRYTGRSDPLETTATRAEASHEDAENLGCFGWIRGTRDRAICLELRKKSGDIVAIPYAYISRMEFQPSAGITLYCGTEKIVVKGRNLNGESRPQIRLFEGLTRHRVPWVQEADRAGDLQAEKKAVVVEIIDW